MRHRCELENARACVSLVRSASTAVASCKRSVGHTCGEFTPFKCATRLGRDQAIGKTEQGADQESSTNGHFALHCLRLVPGQ